MLSTSRYEYDPVVMSDRQRDYSTATPGSLASSNEARDTTSKETIEGNATTSPRKSTTGWQTTALLFGFYAVGESIIRKGPCTADAELAR
jgi:hypothetical protein